MYKAPGTTQDCNQLTFLVLNILIQLSQSKSKPTLRSLFERLDEKKTGAVTLVQLKSQLFKDNAGSDEKPSDKQDDLILIDKDQLQNLVALMPLAQAAETGTP